MSNLVNAIIDKMPLTFMSAALIVGGIALLYYRSDVFRKIRVLFNR